MEHNERVSRRRPRRLPRPTLRSSPSPLCSAGVIYSTPRVASRLGSEPATEQSPPHKTTTNKRADPRRVVVARRVLRLRCRSSFVSGGLRRGASCPAAASVLVSSCFPSVFAAFSLCVGSFPRSVSVAVAGGVSVPPRRCRGGAGRRGGRRLVRLRRCRLRSSFVPVGDLPRVSKISPSVVPSGSSLETIETSAVKRKRILSDPILYRKIPKNRQVTAIIFK